MKNHNKVTFIGQKYISYEFESYFILVYKERESLPLSNSAAMHSKMV